MALVADVVFAQGNQAPLAAFTYSPASPTPGVEVTFTSTSADPDGRIANHEWDLDGDNAFGEAGEPVGPNASTASRSFPSPGSYLVALRVTDGNGAQAVARETVTVAEVTPVPTQQPSPTATSPQPQPPQLRRLPPSFETGRIRGPFSLTARALERLAGIRTDPPARQVATQEVPTGEPGPACPVPRCAPPASKGVPGALLPPAPKPFSCCTNEIDPQIAAGESHLVIGMRHKLLFYDKSGQQLYTRGPSQQNTPYTVQLCDLFKPLIPHMNQALGDTLPSHLDDPDGNAITVKNGYGLNCNQQTGGTKPATWTLTDPKGNPPKDSVDSFYYPKSTIYDARVVWDEYRERFIVAALAYNTNTQRRVVHAVDSPGTVNVARAKRAMMAIAVSKTADPRGGWNTYWTWSYPGQDTCPKGACSAHGQGDFLRAGITSEYLVLETHIWDANKPGADTIDGVPGIVFGERRNEVVVIPADIAGPDPGKVTPVYSNDEALTTPDGEPSRGPLWPAVQHAPDVSGGKLFLASQYAPKGADGTPTSHNVLLWMLVPGASTEIYQQAVPVNAFAAITSSSGEPYVPQPNGQATRIFGAGIFNGLVYRNASLYLAFAECGLWVFDGCQQSALRFVRIAVNGIVSTQGVVTQLFVDKQVDRTFYGPAADDPPDGVAWYGFPGVEANKNGDAVIAYQRSGTFVNPEVRYSAYYRKEADVRASRLLMAGDSGLKKGAEDRHYMGISVDPWDETGIWMIHAFAKGGGVRYAIGKALAPGHPDLTLAAAGVLKAKSGRRAYKLRLRVRNQGDGAAGASVLRLSLPSRRAKASASRRVVRIPRLARGRSRTVRLRVRAPKRGRLPRVLKVSLDTKGTVREYGERDNTALIRLPRRRGSRAVSGQRPGS